MYSGDCVLFAERANELVLCGVLKPLCGIGVAKASLNGRISVYSDCVAWARPETRRATHGQGESTVIGGGGPNPLIVQHHGMTCV